MTSMATPVDVVSARRIGFLSDTHFMAPDGSDVPEALLQALVGVDLIVHLGHVSNSAALDRLESVAPVLAVRTELDDKLFGEQLDTEIERGRMSARMRIIEAGGVRIGAVHDFSARGVAVPLVDGMRLEFPETSMEEIVRSKFGAPLDVVAFAATHIDMVLHRQGVLLVNPGSPNLPGGARKGGLGTVVILDVRDGVAGVELVDLALRASLVRTG